MKKTLSTPRDVRSLCNTSVENRLFFDWKRARALPWPGHGIKRLEELIAWQLALELKIEVYRIVSGSPAASRDFKFRDQLFQAASGVEMTLAEGYRRFHAPQIIQFFTYTRASAEETKRWLHDGVHRGHFQPATIEKALRLLIRCDMATLRFMQGLLRSLPPEVRRRLTARRVSRRHLHRMLRALEARRQRESNSELRTLAPAPDDE